MLLLSPGTGTPARPCSAGSGCRTATSRATSTRGDSMSATVMALPLAAENVSDVSSAVVCGPGTVSWIGSSIPQTVSETVASLQSRGVGGAVDEAVRAKVVRVGGVGEAAARVEIQRAVCRAAHYEPRTRTSPSGSVSFSSTPGPLTVERRILVNLVIGLVHETRIVDGNRRIVDRGDDDWQGGVDQVGRVGSGIVSHVLDRDAEVSRAGEVGGGGEGQALRVPQSPRPGCPRRR